MKKVCIITCYKHTDYVRSAVITAALQQISDYDVLIVKNRHKSIIRYPEVAWKLLVCKFKSNPDVFILTFRGYEMLPLTLLLSGRKPVIFDEFINLIEWVVYEHKKIKPNGLLAKILMKYYRYWLKRCQKILTDTKSHAIYSSQLMNIPLEKYKVIPVGADESLFHIGMGQPAKNKNLEVFFYGNMAPLHGINYVLEAAKILKDQPVHFHIVGGKGRPYAIKSIKKYIKANGLKKVSYAEWLDFAKLPQTIALCDVFLGGPFGNTLQAKMVITGKTFQSLATGTTTMVGRIGEQVGFVDKKNCLMVEQGSAQAIVDSLKWCLKNRPNLKNVGRHGYDLYVDKFSAKSVSQQLAQIIETT